MSTTFEISVPAKKRYFERRKTDLVSCYKSLETSDFAFLQNIGHQLSGNGISFGFDKLSEIGAALESAAQSKDIQKCRHLIDQFSSCVEEIGQDPIFSANLNA